MPLTPLTVAHQRPLLEMLTAFGAAGEEVIPGYFAPRDWPIERIATTFAAWGEGQQLPDGWVPCTTTFLEVDGELLGLYNFRHHLNPHLERHGGHVGYSVRPDRRSRGHATTLLQGAMTFGRSRGLSELVLTTDVNNVASGRVIEKCGGRPAETYPDPAEPGRMTHRWTLPL